MATLADGLNPDPWPLLSFLTCDRNVQRPVTELLKVTVARAVVFQVLNAPPGALRWITYVLPAAASTDATRIVNVVLTPPLEGVAWTGTVTVPCMEWWMLHA